MAQTNVMVTYAPARRTTAPVPKGAVRLSPRWGVTLAGALLAGGAAFALGQFVRPDGSLRDSTLPAYPPLASTTLNPDSTATAPVRGAELPNAESSLLPYLALVCDGVPPQTAERRAPTAPTRPAVARVPSPVAPHAAAIPAQAPRDHPAATVQMVTPPAPTPVAGQRRDLEGFLSDQGLELAASTPASDGHVPAWQSTAEQIVPVESTAMMPASATSTARESAAAPGAGTVGILELTESEAIAPAAPLAETAALEAPEPLSATDDMRLASIEATSDDTRTAAPVRAAPTAALDTAFQTGPRLVAPAPALSRAHAIATPAASQVQLFPMAVVNGEVLGAVTLRDLGAEGQAVHLGALVGLLKLRMPETEFARLSSAAAADRFVTLDQLRATGITVQFDAREGRLLIDAR